MTKPLRLAIVGAVVVGTLVVSLYQTSQRRPSVIREYDWGGMRGSGVANAVGGVDEVDGEPGRFSYYTGARSVDVGPLIAAPTRVLAEAASGSVSLRLLAFDDYGHASARDEALELARTVSAATTGVFPGNAIPVEIDLHFMPEGARFSLAKRVDWREGRPYALALFVLHGGRRRALCRMRNAVGGCGPAATAAVEGPSHDRRPTARRPRVRIGTRRRGAHRGIGLGSEWRQRRRLQRVRSAAG